MPTVLFRSTWLLVTWLLVGPAGARRLAPCGAAEEGQDPPGDCYSVIGVASSADPGEIKRAYRKLALKFHPDKHSDPAVKAEMERKFVGLAHAYDVLSDPEKKEKYDRGEMFAESMDAQQARGGGRAG